MPDISVVLATLGRATLEEQLSAMAGQVTRRSVEVVLVDSAGDGRVPQVADAWRDRLPLLPVVDGRPGFARATSVNRGTRATSGPLVLYLDDDDVVAPGYYEAMADALDEAPLVCARTDTARLNAGRFRRQWGPMQESGPISMHGYLAFAAGGTLGVHRRAYDAVDGYDESLRATEDTDLCWRVQEHTGVGITFVPDALLHYRLRTTAADAFQQAHFWGCWEVELARRYAEHLPPRRHGRAALRQGLRLARSAASPREASPRALGRQLGSLAGRIEGSARARFLYLDP